MEESIPADAVCRFWQDFDLDGLRGDLDERGLAIAGRQESSLQSRKELAESTKDFKKNVAPEVFKAVAPLLKKYQVEVDALTNRSKSAEGAFLDIFQKLQEAPDPSTLLGNFLDSASKIASLESKLAHVTTELDEFKQESQELKNQDLTIRKLEDKIRSLQEDLVEKEQEVEEARAAADAELEARTADEARLREERLEKELSRAQSALETIKRLHASTQAQLLAAQEKGEEVAAAARSESELAMAEVERAEQRLAELSTERDTLLEKMKSPQPEDVKARGGHTKDTQTKALHDEIKSQRDYILKLREEVESVSLAHQRDKDTFESKIYGLQTNLEAKESHINALEAQLMSRPSQEELRESKQQIRMLKAILQNSAADEDDNEEDDESKKSEMLHISSMESALLEKNQKLESNLTLLRMQLAESKDSLSSATGKIQELQDHISQKEELIAQLEEDLELATRTAAPEQSDGSQSSSGIERTTSGIENKSMIHALGAQRDRLKKRVSDLEGEISDLRIELHHAKEASKNAKEDNIALVERLKYVEGYISRGSKTTSDIEKGGASIEKYMKEYENKMNPFNDFRAREREARRRKLPIHDRAAYAVGSAFVSGSKIARSAIVIYALALHFIAFIVIAGFSHRHSEKMDELESLCMDYNIKHGLSGGDKSVVDPVMGG
ncbi:hypothetical protein M9434_001868 [Picochlorum sp. BPE23]|nr:hypothetical protein M9434_001868 [Picochlorum sp. BPE23]KAI8110583.1 hypothetical protein M9435_002257 [Picochlorum sp. BPE23]